MADQTILPLASKPVPSAASTTQVRQTITLADKAIAEWKDFCNMWNIGEDKVKFISPTQVEVDAGIDLLKGLTFEQFTKLMGGNFNQDLFNLIDGGTVIGGDKDNNLSAEQAEIFFQNVKRYGALLGFDMTKPESLKAVADMYNKAGVEFKEITKENEGAVRAAAADLAGKITSKAELTAWNNAKTLANTKLLSYAALGIDAQKPEDKTKRDLIDVLVNAYWTKVLGKTKEDDPMTDDELKRLWSFLSFWRNVPDATLKDWGIDVTPLKDVKPKDGSQIYVMDDSSYSAAFANLVPPAASDTQAGAAGGPAAAGAPGAATPATAGGTPVDAKEAELLKNYFGIAAATQLTGAGIAIHNIAQYLTPEQLITECNTLKSKLFGDTPPANQTVQALLGKYSNTPLGAVLIKIVEALKPSQKDSDLDSVVQMLLKVIFASAEDKIGIVDKTALPAELQVLLVGLTSSNGTLSDINGYLASFIDVNKT